MSVQWLRLWHDMPNDPKWRTISRVSGESIPAVISVYLHMLVRASNANERGRTQGWCDEDVATALDLTTERVASIRAAMQGRVLDGDFLLGWDKRQPVREDDSAERAKLWREKKKLEEELKEERKRTQANAEEQTRTQTNLRVDKEEDKEEELRTTPPTPSSAQTAEVVAAAKKPRVISDTSPEFEEDWPRFWSSYQKQDAFRAYQKARGIVSREVLMAAVDDMGPLISEKAKLRQDLEGRPITMIYPATWMNRGCYRDNAEELEQEVAQLRLLAARSKDRPKTNGYVDRHELNRSKTMEIFNEGMRKELENKQRAIQQSRS